MKTAVSQGSRTRKKLSMDGNLPDIRPLEGFSVDSQGTLSLQDFINKQSEFVLSKRLEGLSQRTLSDYKKHFEYLNRWLKQEYLTPTDTENRYIEKGIFLGYVGYLIAHYKPCTVNLRLRTLKCFLSWLHSEQVIKEDISAKLKLVKVPKDTIQPLTPQEVQKILKVLDLSTYADYRDFCMMLVMLDTGIRVNEACNVLLADVNRKSRLLTVRSETAKTREERQLPISTKTMKYLDRLINIAETNTELYLFPSSYGGQMGTLSVIKRFEEHGRKAGLTKRTTPHIFRHTMAVTAVKAGMDIFTLQKLLGHSNITTTRQYIQLNTDDLINSHSKINVIGRFI